MVAIFIASLMTQSMNTISLVLQGVMETYTGTDVMTAQLIISVANLVALVAMLIVGKLVCFITKKLVLVAMMACLAIGGLLGYFCTPNLAMVFVACGFVGFGAGGLIPLSSALIGEYFEGTARAMVMGTQSIFVNGGGMLLNLAGGFLAAMYWKDLFFIYLPSIIIAIIILVLLPKGSLEKPEEKGERVPLFTPFLGVLMFQGFFNGLAMMTFMANITPFIFELGIGNEAQAGIVTMAFSGGAVVSGILIAVIMKGLKRYVFAVGLTLSAVALWLFFAVDNYVVFIVAGVLIGAGFTFHNTPYYTLAPANCDHSNMTMTMSLYTVAMQVGMILCPIIVTPLAASFSSSLSSCFLIGAIAVTIVAAIAYFTPQLLKKYKLTLD